MRGVLRNSGLASTNEGTNIFVNCLFSSVECNIQKQKKRIDLTMSSVCLVLLLWKLVVLIVFNRTVTILIARMVTARCCRLRISNRS